MSNDLICVSTRAIRFDDFDRNELLHTAADVSVALFKSDLPSDHYAFVMATRDRKSNAIVIAGDAGLRNGPCRTAFKLLPFRPGSPAYWPISDEAFWDAKSDGVVALAQLRDEYPFTDGRPNFIGTLRLSKEDAAFAETFEAA